MPREQMLKKNSYQISLSSYFFHQLVIRGFDPARDKQGPPQIRDSGLSTGGCCSAFLQKHKKCKVEATKFNHRLFRRRHGTFDIAFAGISIQLLEFKIF